MTRLFLAAGVAALAIAAPTIAGPHDQEDKNQTQVVRQGGGGQRASAAPQRQPQTAIPPRGQRQELVAPPVERQQQGAAAVERQQRPPEVMRANPQPAQTRIMQQQQVRVNGQQAQTPQQQPLRANRQQQAQQLRANRIQQVQNRQAQQQEMRMNRQEQVQAQIAERQQMRANNVNTQVATNRGVGYGVGGCPPGLSNKGCMPPGQAAKLGVAATVPIITAQNAVALRSGRVDELNARLGTRLVAPTVATSLIGAPVTTAPSVLGMALNPVPQSISYLYPATPQYYYQYAPGYVYQVDRSTSLIDALIPLLAGGYMPGSYLPSSYMNSYVPDYYGYDSFYPSSYGADYGYGYGSDYGYGADYANLCNRYAYGVVYQVDCYTGMVENVIPTYAGGYGVGQMLPSAYSTYNVPMQYRSLYYPTADYSYWYAPGAIYQYDPSSSLITSVAALMSPGFTVGQPLPAGYGMYNVPMEYRSTYYDTQNSWYRYNNGYIYQVDPTTQLVTAIVASLLG